MRVLAVANAKGGVGKTTAAVNVSAALALAGHTVGLLDLDPQGSATDWLGGPPGGSVLASALKDGDLSGAFAPCDQHAGLFLASGGAAVSYHDLPLRKNGLPVALSSAIAAGRLPFAFLVLDCPPSAGDLLYNALAAASGVLIPCECSYMAVRGLAQFEQIVSAAEKLNPELDLFGVMPTRATRTTLSRQVEALLGERYGSKLLPTVPELVAVRDAAAAHQSIFTYAPDSKACGPFKETAVRLIDWYGKKR